MHQHLHRDSRAIGLSLGAALLAGLAACGGGGDPADPGSGTPLSYAGALTSQPGMDGYGSVYFDAIAGSRKALKAGASHQLEATFTWRADPAPDEHALVSFSQAGKANNYVNDQGRLHFTHGAGAYVGHRGLALELWFVTDEGAPGYDDDRLNAHYWTQDNGRCVGDVLHTEIPHTQCLSDSPLAESHLTPNPGFLLKRNTPYTLRITLSRNDADHEKAWLFGELLQPCADPLVCDRQVVQTARVGFAIDDFFPLGDVMNADVARTRGAEPIDYTIIRRF